MFIGTEIVEVNNLQFPLPVRYASEGGNDWILTLGFERNLALVPATVFASIERSIRSLNILNPNTRILQRLLLGSAAPQVLDANRMINIPAEMANAAELGSEIVLVGQGAMVEIWNTEVWAKQLVSLAAGQQVFDPTISITLEGIH